MKETILRGIQDDDLYEAFKCFDSDKDGYITAAELHQSLSSLGEDIEIEDAVDMVKDIDSNGDGLIDFQGNIVGFKVASRKTWIITID